MGKTILRNGLLWGRVLGDIEFDSSITRIGKGMAGGFDLKGALVFPGLIDAHAHMRAPGAQSHKGDYSTEGRAAVHGGVTTVFDMPNKSPAIDSADTLRAAQDAALKSPAKVKHFVLATRENVDFHHPYYKIVYGGTTATSGIAIDDIRHHLTKKSRVYFAHVEKEEHFVKSENHCETRPVICEHEGIRDVKAAYQKANGRIQSFARSVDEEAKLHFTHLTTARSVALASPYTCDTTPHYFFLCERDYLRQGAFGQVLPPLRKKAEMEGLRKRGVLDDIYCIVTDHAPHTYEEKTSDSPPSGLTELDTLLPLLMSGVDAGWLAVEDILQKCVYNPAKLMGLKAGLEVGNAADLVVLKREPWTVTREKLETKCKISPYLGLNLDWQVQATFVDGNLVYGEV